MADYTDIAVSVHKNVKVFGLEYGGPFDFPGDEIDELIIFSLSSKSRELTFPKIFDLSKTLPQELHFKITKVPELSRK